TQESREVLQFHYTTWPDFGVPESPASFLNFLFKVRESGCLSSEQGPVVVHCSAGIGRSGTFCLVDSCLLLMSTRDDPSSVRIRDVLLEMRKHRMGLIQTADQLRFSYLAVIEGAKCVTGDASVQESWKELSNEDDPPENTPPLPRPPKDPHNGTSGSMSFFPDDGHEEVIRRDRGDMRTYSSPPQLRRRGGGNNDDVPPPVAPRPDLPDGRLGFKEQPTNEQKHSPQHDHEEEEERETRKEWASQAKDEQDEYGQGAWTPLMTTVCLCTALALGAYVCYRTCFL
ncbi:tyrosine-protein phosphatase non-receptor type 1-like isoform X2, partial [Arapaima gigas]